MRAYSSARFSVVFDPFTDRWLLWVEGEDEPELCWVVGAGSLLLMSFFLPMGVAMCAGEPGCRGNAAYVLGGLVCDVLSAPLCLLGWGTAGTVRKLSAPQAAPPNVELIAPAVVEIHAVEGTSMAVYH